MSSFQLLDYSHQVELAAEGRKIEFIFNEIFLPDSTSDFEGSQGFVRYRIKPKAEYLEGDTIRNRAFIYFDFNEPIITNTVTTVWTQLLSTVEQAFVPGVFPNPGRDILHVRMPAGASASHYELRSLRGELLKSGRIPQGEEGFSLSTGHLSPGVYLLRLRGKDHFRSVKWIKM